MYFVEQQGRLVCVCQGNEEQRLTALESVSGELKAPPEEPKGTLEEGL